MTALTEHRLARASWEALGTSVELVVSDGDELARARAIVERGLDEIDRACSRFREDSELTRVNAHAGRTVEADPLLIEAIEVALRAAELTDGDVDPTVGVALELAGYDRDGRCSRSPAESSGGDRPATTACARACERDELRLRRARACCARIRTGLAARGVDRERAHGADTPPA